MRRPKHNTLKHNGKTELKTYHAEIAGVCSKALLIYTAKADIRFGWERSHINITKRGRLTVVFNNGKFLPTQATVRIGDFAKYPVFVDKLLSMLQEYTGKTYTEKDLNIY